MKIRRGITKTRGCKCQLCRERINAGIEVIRFSLDEYDTFFGTFHIDCFRLYWRNVQDLLN